MVFCEGVRKRATPAAIAFRNLPTEIPMGAQAAMQIVTGVRPLVMF